MSKSCCAAFACILTVLGFAGAADAANYTCPAPNLIKGVPADKTIGLERQRRHDDRQHVRAEQSMCQRDPPLHVRTAMNAATYNERGHQRAALFLNDVWVCV